MWRATLLNKKYPKTKTPMRGAFSFQIHEWMVGMAGLEPALARF